VSRRRCAHGPVTRASPESMAAYLALPTDIG